MVASDNTAKLPRRGKRQSWYGKITTRGALGRRLVTYLFLASAAFSLLATVVQLSFAYQRDKAEAIGTLAIVEQSFRPSMEQALWEFNFGQVELLLDSIIAKRDIVFLSLFSQTQQSWQRGTPRMPNVIRESLELTYIGPTGVVEHVGVLRIDLSLDGAISRAWSNFWSLILANLGRTLTVSIVFLALFDRLVTRHLTAIARNVEDNNWLDRPEDLSLKRPNSGPTDVLDEITHALNEARGGSHAAFEALSLEVEERRKAEVRLAQQAEALEHLNDELEKSNRDQAQFTYAISHDLKSPANTIRMLIDELNAHHREELSPEVDELVQCTDQTVRRMAQIVEDVQTYSRVVGLDVEPEEVDISQLAKEVVADLRAEIRSSGATVNVGPIPFVMGGRVQLRLMLQNLLSNAIKFARLGVPPVIEIVQAPPRPDGMVRITMQDNGIGIATGYQESVFSLFKKLHAHEIYPGTGLGLTLCRRIVTNHGGSITILPQAEPGTTFCITLPAAAT